MSDVQTLLGLRLDTAPTYTARPESAEQRRAGAPPRHSPQTRTTGRCVLQPGCSWTLGNQLRQHNHDQDCSFQSPSDGTQF